MTQTLTIDAARRRGRRALVYAALLLAAGAAASVWGWHRAATGLRANADAEFDRFAQLAFANVQQRTLHQNDLLSSFQALFRTGAPVSPCKRSTGAELCGWPLSRARSSTSRRDASSALS